MQSSIFSNIKVSYIAVLLAAVVLYAATCAPGPLWQDSGVYQYRIWHNDIEGKLGLALSHPLYHIIGIFVKYIPIGEFGYRINLLSAIAGAFAVANLFLLLRLWLRKNFPAILAAITLSLSHYYAMALGFGQGMTVPTIATSVVDIFRGPRVGAIIGAVWFGFAVGGAVGPWLGGWIFEVNGSYLLAFILAMVFYAVGCAAIWWAAPRKMQLRAQKPAEHPACVEDQ